jgi:RNA polymerase sigma-70 factor (ECF subfamily)
MPETDSRLLKRAQEGDESGFLALYQRYRTPLFRFAWRLTGSTPAAEDVLQECFLALLEGSSFDGEKGSLRGYLFGIARHQAFRRMRVAGREEEETEDTAASPGPFE